jgi:beta-glucosidase
MAAEKDNRLHFPPGFLWGVGTSAFQVEGSPTADGKGESIWDRWTHIPGKVKVSADVAVDHYHRFKDDLPLLKELGVNTYRFSVAWTRVLPDGRGKPNEKGIAFYKDMVSRLRDAGIKPAVTLFHWDTPQKLQNEGGWANRNIVDAFEQYAQLMVSRLGDDVAIYTTFNEPWVTCYMGHFYGTYPPGMSDFSTAWLCNHHVNLAHGRAVKVIRKGNPKAKVCITLDKPLPERMNFT